MVVGKHTGGAHQIEPDSERLSVAQYLLGRWTACIRKRCVAEELVVRSDDVLDCGAILCLLNPKAVHEDGPVWNERRHPLQLGKLTAGRGQTLENRRALEAHGVDPIEIRDRVCHCLWYEDTIMPRK